MANKYNDILTLVNAGNQMGLSNTIKRDYGIPLDFTSVQESYDAAVIYAATSTLAYVGQTVAVGGKLYIITDVSSGSYTVGEGDSAKTYENFLAEVGSKTEGDGNTIELDGQTLKLAGLTGLDNSKTYVPSLINGKLVWAEPDTSTAEGQAQEINALKTRATALEETVNGTEGTDGLVKKVTDNTAAIATEKSEREASIQNLQTNFNSLDSTVNNIEISLSEKVDGVIFEQRTNNITQDIEDIDEKIDTEIGKVTTAVESAINTTKAYTDTEIAGLTVSIEKKESVDYIIIKNSEGTEITSVNASTFVQDSFLDDVAYDSESGKITFTWVMGDGSTKTDEVAVADFVQTYTAGTGLVLEGNAFSVDTEVIATVEALDGVRETAEAAQTAQEVSDAIDEKITAQNLGQYAIKSEVDTALNNKVNASDYATDKATFATKGEVTELSNTIDAELNNYVTTDTAEGTYAKIGDSYTKGEVDTLIGVPGVPAVGEEGQEGYIPAVPGTGVYQHVYSKDEVTDLIADITGGESAADVLAALNAYKTTNDTRVKSVEDVNTQQGKDITAAKEQADKGVADAKVVSDALAELVNGTVANNTSDINTIKGRLETLETARGTNEQRLTTAEGKISALEGANTSINTAIGTIQGQITTLTEEDARIVGLIEANTNKFAGYYTKGEVDTKVQEAIDAIPDVDFTPYAKTADVNAALELKANATDVYTKTEADAAFMTETEVDNRINALIVASDPEGGKTITDIQNLVKYVDENAGEIASLITATGANTAKLAGVETTVIDYVTNAVNTAIAGVVVPKASTEVTVAADGTLGLGEVSTDKLVQGTEEFIINGGSASV